MAQQWQKDLPEAQGSLRVKSNTREVWRSTQFRPKTATSDYVLAVFVRWDDHCNNGTNSFYAACRIIDAITDRESDYFGLDDVPPRVRATLPAHLRDLPRWNGCHPFGPWYYIENTVFHAGDRDCNGLLKGEVRQIRNGRTGELAWKRGYVNEAGEVVEDLPPQYADGPTQPHHPKLTVAYVPWNLVGEGKARELNHARSTAIWPDATDEDLIAPGLEDRLKARLPALLVEFRKVVESLGFTW